MASNLNLIPPRLRLQPAKTTAVADNLLPRFLGSGEGFGDGVDVGRKADAGQRMLRWHSGMTLLEAFIKAQDQPALANACEDVFLAVDSDPCAVLAALDGRKLRSVAEKWWRCETRQLKKFVQFVADKRGVQLVDGLKQGDTGLGSVKPLDSVKEARHDFLVESNGRLLLRRSGMCRAHAKYPQLM